jgi:4-carboxymuconolactone decarboxylase
MSVRITALSIATLGVAANAWAQDRMPPLAPEQMNEAQRAAVAELEAVRSNGLRGPWIPLLRSPEVLSRARAMGDYLRFRSALAPRQSEFLILLTACDWTQQYEWQAHHQIALDAGLNAETAAAIAAGRRPDAMTEDETALYALWSELTRYKSVSDDTYARAVARFGEQGVIDAVGIVGYYTLLAMVMNTARTPLPADAAPALRQFP